jgi:hypothetical protein
MGRDHIVSVRLTDAELERLSELAAARSLSMSEMLRGLICASQTQWPPVELGGTMTIPSSPASVVWLLPNAA